MHAINEQRRDNLDAGLAAQRAEQLDLNSMASHGTLGIRSARQSNRVRPFTGNARPNSLVPQTTRNLGGV